MIGPVRSVASVVPTIRAALVAAVLMLPAAVEAQTGTVIGRMTSDLGGAVVGGLVQLDGSSLTALTDDGGRYVLSGVPLGRAVLRFTAAGFFPVQAAVDVSVDEPTTWNLLLKPVAFEPFIVTVQRREQEIQDVGMSVTALDAESMRSLGVTTTTDLIAQVPNVFMQDIFGGPGLSVNVAIRGVGLNDFNDGSESPSVIYVDDFYVLPGSAGSMLLYDMDRTEVLRGPQGTLFGRNVTGGLVHFITRDPSDRNEGYLLSEVGEYGLFGVEGAVNVPISDRLAMRFSGRSLDSDPWVTNIGPGDDGGETDSFSTRGQLRWVVTDDIESVTKLTFSRHLGRVNFSQGDLAEAVDPSGFVISGGPGPFVSPGAVQDFTVGETDSPEFIDNDVWLGVHRLRWDLGSVSLASVTGYLDVDRMNFEDCDGTPLDSCRAGYDYRTEEFTQELRVSGAGDRWQWTTGAYLLRQDARAANDGILDADGSLSSGVPGFGFGGPFVFDVDWDLEVRGWALFGQTELAVTDRLALTAGIRYSRDQKVFEMTKRDFVAVPGSNRTLNQGFDNMFPGVFVNGIGSNVNFTRDGQPFPVDVDFDLVPDTMLAAAGSLTRRADDLISAKLGLDWRSSERLLVYGSWSRGAKAGGFNNGFVTVGANTDIPFGPETLDAFEVGLKTAGSGSTRLSASAFHYQYGAYQAVAFEGLGTRTLNKDAVITGAEIEIEARPFLGLQTRLGLSAIRSKVKGIANGVVTFDGEMGLAPDFSANGLVRYSRPVGGGTVAVQGDFYWTDDQFSDVLNDPGLRIDRHSRTNGRVSFAQGVWEVSAWVRNITNAAVPTFRWNLGLGSIGSSYRPPRWLGAGLRYSW